jgi:hypothetical protein
MASVDDLPPLQCCICGQGGEWAETFGMTLFPALDVEPFQQWYVHPRCISDVMRGQLGPLRDEIQAMWPDD